VAVAIVERVITVPTAAAARAVAASPSSWHILWIAVGATSNGIETSVPSTVVAADTLLTSTSMRGRSFSRENASTFSWSVRSSHAPPAKYPSAPSSSTDSASRS
jgi:hypothetical protein